MPSFSFAYNKEWLQSKEHFLLDPDISLYSGPQFPNSKENFGIFMGSMPDTWERTLMKRREAQKETVRTLYDIDFLFGVFDESRMGALRFRLEEKGPFLDDNRDYSTPPLSSIRELQNGASRIESDDGDIEIQKWLSI